MLRRCAPLALLLSLTGCGDDDGDDATAVDATVVDSGPRADADPAADLGEADLGEPGSCGESPAPDLALENLLDDGGFDQPVFVTSAPGEPDVLYVVEKPGRIVRVVDGSLAGEPFLDFTSGTGFQGEREVLITSGEQGLLGLAFHPDYVSNGRFFVFFTPRGPLRNVVAEYVRSADPTRAESAEVARLVEITDTESNHNGGMIAFGPDGYLYAGTGDEGGGGDDHGLIGNAQNTSNLFGNILRLDVDNAAGEYASPGAPFVAGALPQIWAYGLRNPWRFSFDSVTGDLWIGDVGQSRWEEIDFLPAGYVGGANFGWRAYEGASVFDDELTDRVDMTAYVPPVIAIQQGSNDEVLRNAGSVTGGVVYRGTAIDGLQGFYVYSDYLSNDVAAFQLCDGSVQQHARLPGLRMAGGGVVSINPDGAGELLLVNLNQSTIFRIVEAR